MNESTRTSDSITPNKQLAASIAAELLTRKLVLPTRQSALESKLVAGTMKDEDWRTEIAAILNAESAKMGEAQ